MSVRLLILKHTIWYGMLQTMTRLKKDEWLEHGLKNLAASGPSALTINGMCGHIGVTKGSFYHHFKSRNVFIGELLAYWEQRDTNRIISHANEVGDVKERVNRLDDEISRFDSRLERAIRSWARQSKDVAKVLNRVDKRRIGYLHEVYSEYSLEEHTVRQCSLLAYACYVGTQELSPIISKKESDELNERFNQLLEAYVSRQY